MRTTLLATLALLLTACAHDRPAPQTASASDKYCVTETGSYIKKTNGECVAGPGRTYSREELERTGEIDNARALRDLDPSIH
jgi:hypothetical protein